MKKKLVEFLRKAMVSICISAAMLALANSETIWQEYHHDRLQENLSEVRSVEDFVIEPHEVASSKTVGDELRDRMHSDQILGANPFMRIENQTALEEIFDKDISHFRREAYRSPESRDKNGYDLLSYEIDNQDGSHSSILTYVESRKRGMLKPFVVVITPTAQGNNTYYFRDGKLLNRNRLSLSEASRLIARHLSGGTPLFTVSR